MLDYWENFWKVKESNSQRSLTVCELTVGFLMPPHPLTNFEIQKCYQSKRKFNITYSKDKLPKIKDGTWIVYLDGWRSHWVVLYMNGDNVTYCDSFGAENITREKNTSKWFS